ncbi:hypothetical protein OHA19_39895 (plasmid) [Streptomyces sp. NBC_00012]|uniref:hypothetical protein n=1 Tax=Streptomyces sp. NBC_00012 TaxID=2975621 RepID=UPI002F917CB3
MIVYVWRVRATTEEFDELAPDILAALDTYRAHHDSCTRPRTQFLAAWPHLATGGAALVEHPGSDARFRFGAFPLARLLQGACYILIADLSGMRDSEIKHLHADSTRALRDSSGHAYRWSVTSRAFKGETDPSGTIATWIIGAPAARAVTVLERLQPPETELLFRSVHPNGRIREGALTLRSSNELINHVITWINAYCRHYGLADALPDVNGAPWNLTARQFRRTLAWHIARRPGGVIAGAVQYRHLGIQMFEGYANPRELHQTGEKSQVASSGRRAGGLQRYYELTA